MWLEFLGLPGSGKSTFYAAHRELLEARFRVVESRRPTRLHGLVARFHRRLGPLRGLRDPALAAKLAHRLSFRPLGRGRDVYFQDAGILQVILEDAVATGFADQEAKLSVAARLPLPDAVVWFGGDPDKVAARELARTPRRFDIERPVLVERYRRATRLAEERLLPLVPVVRRAGAPDTVAWLSGGASVR